MPGARELKEPSHAEIAERAYFHWLADGIPRGHDWRHWFTAETELMQQELMQEGILWARYTEDLRPAIE